MVGIRLVEKDIGWGVTLPLLKTGSKCVPTVARGLSRTRQATSLDMTTTTDTTANWQTSMEHRMSTLGYAVITIILLIVAAGFTVIGKIVYDYFKGR